MSQPPGLDKPRRLLPRFHYELLACGLNGHELLGLDAAELRPQDEVFARQAGSTRWLRCLRCDSWIPLAPAEPPTLEHPPDREQVELPLRGRALRDKFILRLIALDRVLHFVILVTLAAAIFLFVRNQTQLRDGFYRVVADLQGGLRGPSSAHRGLVHELDRVFSLQSGKLRTVGIVVLAYGLLEGVEAVGLWMAKRWAEYLTFIATTVLLPLEVYEIITRQSVLKIITFLINLAVVLYLIWAKRLFGLRGGERAVEAERRRDMGWEALERTTPDHGSAALPGGVAAT